jgi:hypothetical protein
MTQMCDEDRMELAIARNVTPRLSGIEGKLDVFNTLLTQLSTQLAKEQSEQKKSIEEIQAILRGDGRDAEGLVATVLWLRKWIEDEKKLRWAILLTVMGETVALVFAIIRGMVIHIP